MCKVIHLFVAVIVGVVGDILGPALDNIDDLLKMPYGCGEQNMVNFAPNIFALQYLEATNQDTQNIREKAIGHMKSGQSILLPFLTSQTQLY